MNTLPVWADRYLERLGLEQELPTRLFLEKFCRAHLNAVPFENISKLMYLRDYKINKFHIPPIDVYVENMFRYDFGGTCYTNNSHALKLLKTLGYEGYHVELGKSHIGIMIELDGERLYLDFGSASPFFKPVNFEKDTNNLTAYDIEEIRILPDSDNKGTYRFIRYRDGKVVKDDWDFNPDHKMTFEAFEPTITKSNQPGAFFLSHLRCHHYQISQNRTLSLVNNTFSIRYENGEVDERILQSEKEITEVLQDEYQLPKLPVVEAIRVLESLGVDLFEKQMK
ncbi:arylamine N-acetyltransferase [Pseudalkalibacillus berkeleyi]|uniref:Arylamine N-acetyltransferase n=1 Tax=Pseudalkalibacillus berkeleyi TaxID=1069813 RepID=A0ABS9GYF7_9BACL|nr:arylamine N-acetyltransferase [Pseudalkalibacillus berkeleyi]MCF6136640.1 arylamine N-acetyltransferase [Pseudalkalibacillus berkeleyi]